MKELDEMLDRWIHNSIIRKQFKDLIEKCIKEIAVEFYKSQVKDKKKTFYANSLYENFKLKQ